MLDILNSNISPFDKIINIKYVIERLDYKNTTYTDLKKYRLVTHDESLSELLDTLKEQYTYMVSNKGYTISKTRLDSPYSHPLDHWCIRNIGKYNNIGLIKGWLMALDYLLEIRKVSNHFNTQKNVLGSLDHQLSTFVELSKVIIKELIK